MISFRRGPEPIGVAGGFLYLKTGDIGILGQQGNAVADILLGAEAIVSAYLYGVEVFCHIFIEVIFLGRLGFVVPISFLIKHLGKSCQTALTHLFHAQQIAVLVGNPRIMGRVNPNPALECAAIHHIYHMAIALVVAWETSDKSRLETHSEEALIEYSGESAAIQPTRTVGTCSVQVDGIHRSGIAVHAIVAYAIVYKGEYALDF